jgi:tRNA(fMet)-specific endonuclease VapC
MTQSPLRYLLDTNIVSDLIRNPDGVITKRIEQVGENTVCTSIVVACELRHGAAEKGSARLTEQLEAVLAVLPIVALESGADRHYGELRSQLERRGKPIGANDMLIAAQALSLGLTLISDNTSEMKRVKGLRVKNWLRTS